MEPRDPLDPISPIGPDALTERQREVAHLVAAGLTNGQIAERLGISLDGAKFHVSGLLVRLGLRRREEVGEWYRAHFGPVARMRSWARGLAGLPLGVVGASAAAGAAVIAIVTLVAVRALAPAEVGPPDYVPFVQEWEIERSGATTFDAVLEWNGCGRWRYEERDAAGTPFVSYGRDSVTADEPGCNIPGVWFRPIDSFRGNPNPTYRTIGPFEYEIAYTRDCSEVSNPVEPDNPIGPDFCSEPSDTFEDRVVVEFDPDTLIPMRYSQYVDGVLSFEHRAVSLRLLDDEEVRDLPTGGDGDPLAPEATSSAPPP